MSKQDINKLLGSMPDKGLIVKNMPGKLATWIALMLPLCLLCLYSELLFPYVTSKVWLIRACILFGIAVAVFSDEFNDRLALLLKQPIMWALLAYCCWGLVSNQFSDEPQRAFWSTYERLEGGLGLIFMLLLTTLLFYALGDVKQQRSYLLVFSIVILVLCGSGLITSEKRISGLLGNPIYLGSTAGMGIFVVGLWVSKTVNNVGTDMRAPLRRIVWIGLAILASSVMLFTIYKAGSRGPAVGFLCGFIVAVLYVWKYKSRAGFLKWGTTSFSIVVGLLGAVWLASTLITNSGFDKEGLWYRFLQIPAGNQTTLDRFANWSVAIDVFKERPMIGHGEEAYVREFSEHYQAGVLDNADIWFDRAHNAYLDILVAHGALGLALFFLLLGISIATLLKRTSYTPIQKALLLGLVTCYVVKNLVGFDSPSSHLLWVSFLVFVMLENTSRAKPSKGVAEIILTERGSVILIPMPVKLAISSLLMVGLYFSVIVPFQANHTVLKASRYAKATDSFIGPIGEARQTKLSQLLSAADEQFPAAKAEHLQALYGAMSAKMQFSEVLLEEFYQRSRVVVLQQPNNHRIQYNAAVVLASLGQAQHATALFEHLIIQTPNRTLFWATLYRLYHNSGDAKNAEKALDKVKTLNPKYFKKHFS